MPYLLTILTFLPLLGVAILLFMKKEEGKAMKSLTLAITLANFLISLLLLKDFDLAAAGMQFVEKYSWIPNYGISYYLGIDGLTLLLVLLTTFFTPICVLACWEDIQKSIREFLICLLFLETGMIGVFLSLDLFLFYVFWEVMLIPMYLLIGIWGNPARRVYAAVKFFIYTMLGSVLMLAAILYLVFQYHADTGICTFNLLELYDSVLPRSSQLWLFLAFSLAFAIKVPVFPFHTWLPDAHTEAPTVGSVLLAAVLLKMGAYGFLRFCLPLFPNAALDYGTWLFLTLGLIGIIYGAWVCIVQQDLKRLIAFSSVSHLGFVMIGIFAFNAIAMKGAILQMINHGLSTGALFLIVGMIYERRHTRLIEEFGGLSKVMPAFATLFLIVTLSSIGLPGLNGFVGEFLILQGTFMNYKLFAILGASGVIFAAVYMLRMFQRVMYGHVTNPANAVLKDLSRREWTVLLPVLILIFWIGLYPSPFLRTTETSVNSLLQRIEKKYEYVVSKERLCGHQLAQREIGSPEIKKTQPSGGPAAKM
ncbi:NADH dehydrogenase subunit M [Syntrophus gentianae]|uniref:NADH dehydrogenase subunit M n=1 Tax=Syntrophus gentianae TaxID=43775 RepID=A0A1H7ZIN1_9BACT|nr:NADH-quinone oxidoreductase subunit M [Syntrophus gentianae]SEM58432.1 NADH dehydrogenase subunit M [Syntrophus gentianae]